MVVGRGVLATAERLPHRRGVTRPPRGRAVRGRRAPGGAARRPVVPGGHHRPPRAAQRGRQAGQEHQQRPGEHGEPPRRAGHDRVPGAGQHYGGPARGAAGRGARGAADGRRLRRGDVARRDADHVRGGDACRHGGASAGAEHREQHPGGPPQHPPGGDHGGQPGERCHGERAGQRDEVGAGHADHLLAQRLRRGKDGLGPAFPDREQDQSRADRARQEREAVFTANRDRAHAAQPLAAWAEPTARPGRSPVTAGSRSASKQVRLPVWQAAPTWSTLTRIASASQSSATDFTN